MMTEFHLCHLLFQLRLGSQLYLSWLCGTNRPWTMAMRRSEPSNVSVEAERPLKLCASVILES